MPVDSRLIEEAADRLRQADATGKAIPPVRDLLGTATDIDAAYAVQQINTDHWIEAGRRVSGRKIGVTSKAIQQQVGVDQPDFGTLFVDTEYGDGIEIEAERLIQPRAEAEVALVLERDLDAAPHGFAQIIRAVAFALPSIEVVDSRIDNWDISIVDTVADNASCGVYVLGSRPVPLSAFDALTVPMRMTLDGAEVSTGVGSACLGNPLHAARWLADTMCRRGIPLRAGDVIMTGALGPMVPFGPGQDLVARFGDLGVVTTRITQEGQPHPASDGGIFNYGPGASFHGSTGGTAAAPVIGIAVDPATGGYWLAESDGQVLTFDAPFEGSTGGVRLALPVVAITGS